MANIVETISGDRRLQLGFEEFTRQMGWAADWKKIRVGIRVAFNGSSNITTANFMMGVCNGTANGYKSNTADFIGYRFNSVGGWSFVSGPPAYYTGTFNFASISRQGSTDTLNNSSSASGFVTAVPASIHSAMYVTFTKPQLLPSATTLPTVTGHYPNTIANGQLDLVKQEFYRLLESEAVGLDTAYLGTTSVFNMNGYTGTSQFDSVSIYWNNASPTVEISDIAVCRFE
jgi:hypothetical protein